MYKLLKQRLLQSFELTRDLVVHLEETALNRDLPKIPSNRISAQLWCMVGARESFITAIKRGSWQGFSCSLTAPNHKESVLAKLEATQKELAEIDFEHLNDGQVDLVFKLLEHEIQHHGQLIRYVYGNGFTFPSSWHERYTV